MDDVTIPFVKVDVLRRHHGCHVICLVAALSAHRDAVLQLASKALRLCHCLMDVKPFWFRHLWSDLLVTCWFVICYSRWLACFVICQRRFSFLFFLLLIQISTIIWFKVTDISGLVEGLSKVFPKLNMFRSASLASAFHMITKYL